MNFYSKMIFVDLNQFITEDSKAIHTIITTIWLKLTEVILIRKVFTTEEAPSKLGLGFE